MRSALEKGVLFAQVFAYVRLSEGHDTSRIKLPRLGG
jgi:hypothetical protein